MNKKILCGIFAVLLAQNLIAGTKVEVYEVPYGLITQGDGEDVGRLYRAIQKERPVKVFYSGSNRNESSIHKGGVTVHLSSKKAIRQNYEDMLAILAKYSKKLKTKNKRAIQKLLYRLKDY